MGMLTSCWTVHAIWFMFPTFLFQFAYLKPLLSNGNLVRHKAPLIADLSLPQHSWVIVAFRCIDSCCSRLVIMFAALRFNVCQVSKNFVFQICEYLLFKVYKRWSSIPIRSGGGSPCGGFNLPFVSIFIVRVGWRKISSEKKLWNFVSIDNKFQIYEQMFVHARKALKNYFNSEPILEKLAGLQ